MANDNQTEMEEDILCPKCGHDSFSVAMLHYRPKSFLVRDEETGIEISSPEGEFEGDTELHGEHPYICEGCGGKFSEEQLLAA